MIYLAPLQGFTDYIYRNSYSKIFSGVTAFFTPYIAVKNAVIVSKHLKDILPGHNSEQNIIPQILVKDCSETEILANLLADYGYQKVNLNLGCPYPMVTNRGKGSGLLPNPEKIDDILNFWFKNYNISLSVKLRVGLNAPTEIDKLIPVLNQYPLHEVILHPKTAKQLYSGNLYTDVFREVHQKLNHQLTFNGDIFSVSNFKERKKQFPQIKNWMLGRGILMNPFLPSEIKGAAINSNEKKEKLLAFHQLMLENYLQEMDNEGNAVNKMKQFWIYFSYNFQDQKKAFKQINKCKNLSKFKGESTQILRTL
jgi:tRNA-dihydrouridine synthase